MEGQLQSPSLPVGRTLLSGLRLFIYYGPIRSQLVMPPLVSYGSQLFLLFAVLRVNKLCRVLYTYAFSCKNFFFLDLREFQLGIKPSFLSKFK